MAKDNFVATIREKELPEGRMKAVHAKGLSVLLVRQSGEFFAVSNRCPHMGCTLERGILRGYMVMCPCHGWKFDIRNGQFEENEAIFLEIYRCKTQNGRIYIEIKNNLS